MDFYAEPVLNNGSASFNAYGYHDEEAKRQKAQNYEYLVKGIVDGIR